MNITIACQNTTLTEGLKEAVEQKLGKLRQYTNESLSLDVKLRVDGHRQTAEAKLIVDGTVHNASAESESIYSSLDTLSSRLARLMRKEKTHRLKQVRQTTKTIRHGMD